MKLVAGLFWGLALATKPTSAVVVIALVLFQFCRARGWIERRTPTWRFLSWYDVAAVGTAQLLLVAVYTKLWHTNSSYVWRVGIHSQFASFLYTEGIALRDNWAIVLGAGLAAVFMGWSARRDVKKSDAAFWPLSIHLKIIFAILALLLALWPLRPDVYENLALYWMWAFGLSGESHHGYGYTWTPPPGGYFGLLGRQLPLVVFVGLLSSAVWLITFYRQRRERSKERAAQFLMYSIALIVLWLVLLGVSSKQNVRYILSCFPPLYLCVGFGLIIFVRTVAALSRQDTNLFKAGLLSAIVAGQAWTVYGWRPHYGLYRNPFSGGLAYAVARKESVPPVGIKEAVDFLRSRAKEHGNDLRVMLLGDEYIAKKTERLHYGRDESTLIFIGAGALGNAEYVLVFPAFQKAWEEWRGHHPELEFPEVFAFTWHEAPLVRIYSVPLPDYRKPLRIKIRKSPKHTGNHERYGEGGRWTVVGIPGENKKGYLLHGQFFRFAPGKYEITFPVGLPYGSEFDLSQEAELPVVKLEASQKCTRVVRRSDLKPGKLTDIKLNCEPDKYVRSHVRAYWWGTTPVALAGPSAVLVSED